MLTCQPSKNLPQATTLEESEYLHAIPPFIPFSAWEPLFRGEEESLWLDPPILPPLPDKKSPLKNLRPSSKHKIGCFAPFPYFHSLHKRGRKEPFFPRRHLESFRATPVQILSPLCKGGKSEAAARKCQTIPSSYPPERRTKKLFFLGKEARLGRSSSSSFSTHPFHSFVLLTCAGRK